MTEEDAKTKWCPMSRDGRGANRYEGSNLFQSMNCIASACMLWEWINDFDDNIKEGHCGFKKL